MQQNVTSPTEFFNIKLKIMSKFWENIMYLCVCMAQTFYMVVEAPPQWEVAIISKRTLTLKLKIVWHMGYGRISCKQAPDKKFAPS